AEKNFPAYSHLPYDCGKKLGYMQAFVKYGLRNLKEGPKFRKGIEKLLSE
ncbi:TPA: hypothetical protein ACPZS9_004434, partial [Yersinia enterocolitica]